MTQPPAWLRAAREDWRWRGDERPPFADAPGPDQESVWDYPRPPRIATDPREVVVLFNDREIARTRDAVRVLETSHPPTFYLPWRDVDRAALVAATGESFCEWKGPASYWDVVDGEHRAFGAAWSYPRPFDGAEMLAERVSFYPALVECLVEGHRVAAQPGGFYGGWITPELTGPFKGVPGSAGW